MTARVPPSRFRPTRTSAWQNAPLATSVAAMALGRSAGSCSRDGLRDIRSVRLQPDGNARVPPSRFRQHERRRGKNARWQHRLLPWRSAHSMIRFRIASRSSRRCSRAAKDSFSAPVTTLDATLIVRNPATTTRRELSHSASTLVASSSFSPSDKKLRGLCLLCGVRRLQSRAKSSITLSAPSRLSR